jgi:GntR family transcriptional regulator, phosphonate transport system regulatory protein
MMLRDHDLPESRKALPVWRRVAEELAHEIRNRVPTSDPRLPSEQELARRFAVNRHTVRQALRELAAEGIVRAEQGRGTFVTPSRIDYPLGPRTRLTAGLIAGNQTPSRTIRSITAELATDELARALQLAPKSRVHHVRSVSYANAVAISLSSVLLPGGRFEQASELLRKNPSFTALYATYGITDYRRHSTRIHARAVEACEAEDLALAPGEPVLVTEGIDVDQEGHPLARVTTVWSARRVSFVLDHGATGGSPDRLGEAR